MASTLEELQRVSPPPERPLAVDGDWSRVESDLGLCLPPDFKEFASTYGKGRFGRDEILVFHPLEWSNVRNSWSQRASHFRAWLDAGFNVPYPIFPEFEGLLPCAIVSDVNRINWLTRGSSENWPLVYFDRDHGYFEVELKGLTFVEFLVDIVTGRSELMKRVNCEFTSPPEFEPCSE
ncbi:MAG: SMI1/KNR4 family protein [Planctomycetaceae bacterium]|nr:SMI1/KNR4 family protein [Planctomycetaceae bacterium]MCA9045654.1 SMI1/KNR4 family protein [Planctomycetaceae bacterium]MCB9953203.1 SMI1/KNR4 family protein [Planctomycetaceae bacterium]